MSFMNLQQGSSRGRPAPYQGSAPGTEAQNDNRGFAGSASRGGGGFPFGSMAPSRVIDQTLGWQTNHTINYAYVVRRFKSGFDRALNIGQVVFIRKQFAQPGQNERMFTMMNLPQMNYYLAKLHQSKVQAGEKLTAEEILQEWTPQGVVQGEIGGPEADQPQERLLNLTVAGRTRMFNIFEGNSCPDGTPLYLLLKRVTMHSGEGEGLKTFTVALNGHSDHVKCPAQTWQFVGWADQDKHSPDSGDLGDGGRAIYLGRVSHNSKFTSATTKHTKSAHSDIQRHVTLPMMEVFVDYEAVPLPAEEPAKGVTLPLEPV